MSILDAFQTETDLAIDQMVSRPAPPVEAAKRSAWKGIPAALAKALPAAAAETLAGVAEIGTTVYRASRKMAEAPDVRALDQARAEGVSAENEASTVLRNVAQDYRPDPTTAGAAEEFVFNAGRVIGKAVGYSMTIGPVGAAGALAVDEGLTTFDDLQRKGVDSETASKVAGLTGVATAATALLPVGGRTIAQTAALTLGGGPLTFATQTALTREILRDADYSLAEQYDPLDPVGLAVSVLLPLPFAAVAIRAQRRVSPETMDAAMVHNLTAQQDVNQARVEPELPPQSPEARPPPKTEPAVEQPEPPQVAEAKKRAAEPVDELGEADVDLLRVAAECALSEG